LGSTLSTVDSVLSILGVSPKFSNNAQQLIAVSGRLGQVANLAGLPGQLSTVGSNMTVTGSLFDQVGVSVKDQPGYTTFVGDAIKKMGNSFTDVGTKTMNASNVLDNY